MLLRWRQRHRGGAKLLTRMKNKRKWQNMARREKQHNNGIAENNESSNMKWRNESIIEKIK